MDKVYVMIRGIYSDHIDAIFSTEEKAKRYLAATDDSQAQIEPWDVDIVIPEIERGLNHYQVEMYEDGAVRKVGRAPFHWGNGLYITGTREQTWLISILWARDEQHAIKATNEKRARLIALGRWKRGPVDE